MNEQQIFDKTLFHLRQQVEPSTSNAGVCRYRAHNTACAIGCHLSDEEYTADMERFSVEQLIAKDKFPQRLIPFRALLTQLQTAHDIDLQVSPAVWELQMKTIAKYFGLVYTGRIICNLP